MPARAADAADAPAHRLTRAGARRLAVRAQLLTADRPTDLLDVVRHLTVVQLDPTAAVAPSADVVLWSRLGGSYTPADLRDALDAGSLVELHMMARPAEDVALLRAEMAAWPGEDTPTSSWPSELRDWVAANGGCRQEVLALLRAEGPLPVPELPDTCVRPWRSSGWNHGRDRVRLLELMVARGEVAVVGREGRDKVYDLAERVYPDDPVVPLAEAEAERDRRRLAALGIARPGRLVVPGEPGSVGEAGEPAVVEGVRGRWRVDPALLTDVDDEVPGRTALLSPLDRLVVDRKRAAELFAFDFALEMYKPVAARRWGYWALPVLHHEELVGKVDASAEASEGVLRVDAVHEDAPWSPAVREAVDRELDALATWLGLEVLRLDRR